MAAWQLSKDRPSVAAWLLHALTLILLMAGAFIMFFIPLISGIWGLFSLKKAGQESRKAWVFYVLVAALLFVVMLLMQLLLTPWGEAEKVPMSIAAKAMLGVGSV